MGEDYLQPVTATIRRLPGDSGGTIYLPKVGSNAEMNEEETREALRRFINDGASSSVQILRNSRSLSVLKTNPIGPRSLCMNRGFSLSLAWRFWKSPVFWKVIDGC